MDLIRLWHVRLVVHMKKTTSRFSRKVEDPSKNSNILSENNLFGDDYMADISVLETTKRMEDLQKPPKKVTIADLMEERYEEAVKFPISNSNVGFKLLKKIGYKEGEGLGKEGQGRVDPLLVKKRPANSMSGVGVEEEIARKRKLQDQEKKELDARRAMLKNDFVKWNSKISTIRKLRKDVDGARKAIYELDLQNGVEMNSLWPPVFADTEEFSLDNLSDIGEA